MKPKALSFDESDFRRAYTVDSLKVIIKDAFNATHGNESAFTFTEEQVRFTYDLFRQACWGLTADMAIRFPEQFDDWQAFLVKHHIDAVSLGQAQRSFEIRKPRM